MHRATPFLLLAALVFATYIMLADFINFRAVNDFVVTEQVQSPPLPQPWGGYADRRLTELYGAAWREAPETAASYLRGATVRYPIDAFQWLDRARIAAASGNVVDVGELLAAAGAVQPMNREALWTATQIALQSGNPELAERQLREWLRDQPADTERALFVGRRWIESPDDLLERVLPEGRDYIEQSLRVARRQRDLALVEAAWARLQPRPGLGEAPFLDYIEALLDGGRVADARAAWMEADPDMQQAGIANASFDREFGEGLGLGWRTLRPPQGVRIERDTTEYASAPASLRLDFGGKDNVSLSLPWTRIPVDAGARLTLRGFWRADNLTTRARPFLLIQAEGASMNLRLPVPDRTFAWRPFEIDIDVPEDTQVLRLFVRRDRTNDFDRYIDGTLWIDDLVMEPRAEAPVLPENEASESMPEDSE